MTMMQTGIIPQITLAHRLRIAREFAGMDQATLAEKAEIGRTTIVNYEAGYRVPRRIYLRAIADATGVDLHWLETGEAPSSYVDEASTADVRPKGLEPLTFWSVVTGEDDAFWTANRASAFDSIVCQFVVDEESRNVADAR